MSSPSVSAAEMAAVKTSSNGVWQGDDPLHFAFPLLILQALLILVLSRLLAFLLRPLRQPKVIAEIVAGILLGPSALGRNKAYLRALFPPWSTPVLESVASLGLLFFLFLVGLELDLRSVRRSGRRAFAIAAAGISLPFACGVGVAFVLRRAIPGADQAGYAPFLVFMGVALSITAFPVLARILAELKLLTTPIGETALAAAAFNDVAAWVLLALAVAISGGGHRSPVVSLWVLLCGAAFVAAWMVVVKPAMSWVARRADAAGQGGDVWVAATLAGVLASGLATDTIGIHAIFGAFVFGLTVPKEGEFAGRVTERVEDLVSELLLPLYFASSGLKTDVATIRGGEAWAMLALVIGTACAGKIVGTFAVAMACGMSAREAVVLGVVMNTKGLVELIVLNIGRERKVLNEETFAILVLMALVTTFITTPTVMAIYKPARTAGRRLHHRKLQGPVPSAPSSPSASAGASAATANAKELRVLACIHGGHDVPALINLIETIRGHTQPRRVVKLYILRMVELTERTSSILMARAARRNGVPFLRPRRAGGPPHDQIDVAFDTYAQLGHVHVRAMTAVSALHTMHDDVAAVAEDKRVSLVVLPFHKHQTGHGEDVENLGPEWCAVNRRILREAPCSVAVLVDRGFGGGEQVSSEQVAHGVCVVFFGGPDDREALELAGRMAEHPGVQVTVVRFVDGKAGSEEHAEVTLRPSNTKNADRNYTFTTAVVDSRREKDLDDAAVAEFRQKMGSLVRFEERVVVGNVIEEVVAIGKSREYGLVVVGKGRLPSQMVAQLAVRPAEHPELGPIGDALASSGHGVTSSVLVVQQHDMSNADEVPVSVVIDGHAHDGEFAKDMAEP
ncbi:cation/H(+) antiporter 20-like [Phragmites australis]|uniref:cation/H(+) antiporter 20-like n=1 Tax=Phragmites australis TaxID=29695 RepID=UPI002D77D9F2|nr:cation/H(+) antiporter 20-like [Phragmites australis]